MTRKYINILDENYGYFKTLSAEKSEKIRNYINYKTIL